MKPDPDMMRIALGLSSDALEAIGRFQCSSGFAFGSDATHAVAYHAVRELADRLQSISSKLNLAALECDKRLTPAARMQR